MISFKGRHHQQDIILQCARWYVAYSLSYRDLEELMQERGYVVDPSTIQRWVVHYAPRIEKVFRKNKKRTGTRWRLNETYLKVKGRLTTFPCSIRIGPGTRRSGTSRDGWPVPAPRLPIDCSLVQ